MPVIHFPFCFHTIANDSFSSCAFTGKCRRWPKMMAPLGYGTICYANEGSEIPEAAEVVTMLTQAEFDTFYPRQQGPNQFHGNYAVIGERGWPLFNQRLIAELSKRVQPGDIIAHPFGQSHAPLVQIFPQCVHVETGCGYPDKPFGAWRIFESQAWRHYHWGRWDHDPSVSADERGKNRFYSWVIPNYFDLKAWPFFPLKSNEDYVLYMGRITVLKGMPLIAAIIREEAVRSQRMGLPPTKFVFAGSGDFEKEVMSIALADPKPDAAYIDVEYRGEVFGMDRAKLVGKARCMLMPTTFVEPFGGSGVEAMLAGTPLIAVDYGAFTETVVNGVNGYRCSTLADWMTAIGYSKTLDRTEISHRASELYSLETCAKQYDRAFRQLLDLPYPGWYAATPHASWAGEDTP